MAFVTPPWEPRRVRPLRIAGFDGTVIMVWPVDGWESTMVELHTPDRTRRMHLRPFCPADLAAVHETMSAAVLHDRPGDALIDDALVSLAVEEVDDDTFLVSLSAVLDDEEELMHVFPTSRLAVWNLAMAAADLAGT